jgi:hypothetical protein
MGGAGPACLPRFVAALPSSCTRDGERAELAVLVLRADCDVNLAAVAILSA